MIRLVMNGDKPAVTQTAVAPCVYLDQWAYMLLVKEPQQLRRFATALVKSGGTLAFSNLNWNELSQVSDVAQLKQIENLFEQIWPSVAFIENDPTAVISKEDKLLQGISGGQPHLDDWLLNKYANFCRSGANPLGARGFLLQLRNHSVSEGFREGLRSLATKMQAALERAKHSYITNEAALKEVRSLPRGPVFPHRRGTFSSRHSMER